MNCPDLNPHLFKTQEEAEKSLLGYATSPRHQKLQDLPQSSLRRLPRGLREILSLNALKAAQKKTVDNPPSSV